MKSESGVFHKVSVITTTFGFGSSFQVITNGPSFSMYLVEQGTKVLRLVFRMARSVAWGLQAVPGAQHRSVCWRF